MKIRILHITLFISLILGWTNYVQAQSAPLVNTIIPNKAQFSFIDAEGNYNEGFSNEVEAVIAAKTEILIYPDNFIVERKGRDIVFEHVLVNNSNYQLPLQIQVIDSESDSFQFESISIFVFTDEGRDNPFKQTEYSLLNLNQSIVLDAYGARNIKVNARIPEIVKAGDIGKLEVRILDAANTILIQSKDSVKIIAGTQIDLSKVILEETVVQGGDITFEINGTNTGDVAALSIPITVDGTEQRFVLLKDFIPPNTTFKLFEEVGLGVKLYHVINTPEDQYISFLPADLEFVDQIAVGFSEIAVSESFLVRFKVTVNQNATGEIENIAEVVYNDGLGEQASEGASNLAVAPLPELKPRIQYFTDNTFTSETNITDVGQPLFLQADAAGCNKNSLWADSTIITIVSEITGDEESFLAIETGRNTGIFRVNRAIPTRDFAQFPPQSFNDILETTENDALIATLDGCGQGGTSTTVRATVYVTPVGVVFDAESNRTIANARVQILDVSTNPDGVPAMVTDSRGIETLSNDILTQQNGEFVFPRLAPGQYKVIVTPPVQYNFPSQITAQQLPAGRNLIDEASWGNVFTIDAPFGPARFDIPLDVNGLLAMDMTKNADRTYADIGGFVNYEIEISNLIQNTIKDVKVTDQLPFGFSYLPGSAQVDGNVITDPIGGKGPILEFSIGDLDPTIKKKLVYRLKVTPGAIGSDGKNTAVAFADELIDKISNEADVTVRVEKGVFSDEGFIIGKVFYDKNKNRVQDAGEPGVPGIRIYMENGNYIETDALGKYSFYGVRPKRHVLKLDVSSLPEGAGLVVLDNRHALDPSSRFVDLQKGELHKADFAICDDEGDILPQIRSRFANLTDLPAELAQGLKARLEAKATTIRQDAKVLPSSGLVGSNSAEKTAKSFNPLLKEGVKENYWKTGSFESTLVLIEELLEIANTDLGFLNLRNGDTLRYSKTSIMVKGPLGSQFKLFVNGNAVSESIIGKKSNSPTTEGWDFVGVELKEGENSIELVSSDPFGNIRDKKTITVYAPGTVESIKLSLLNDFIPADGKSLAKLKIELLDKNGLKVKSRTPVTLDISLGKTLTEDLNPTEIGTQQFIEGGDGVAFIEAPIEPGTSIVNVNSGTLQTKMEIVFSPNLRPLIAAGIIEGAIRLKNGFRIDAVNGGDVFEEELRSLNSGGDTFSASARTAFFIKGKILGEYLLTASFDSEQEERGMFRDIQPDEYYPIYGDASVKGFDAQSSGRLFVRVDKNKHFGMYGDFNTMDQSAQRNLGQFTRNMTGVKAHYETAKVKANLTTSIANSRQVIEELPALGISGPYRLKFEDIKENSERIEIITRDRNQVDVILKTEVLTRFKDYTIEPFSGHVFFKFPVFSLDEELNPRFIRISYEATQEVDNYVVASTDAQYKVTDQLEVGATAYVDRNPTDSYNLVSANTAYAFNANSTVIAEVAHTISESKGNGLGGRIEYKHQGTTFNGRVFAGKTDQEFSNPFSMIGTARTEAGLKGTVRLGDKTMLKTEALLSRNDTTNAIRQGAMINLQRGFNYGLQAELGIRYSKDDQKTGTAATEQGTVRGKLQSQLPFLTSAQVYGEYEQSIASIERKIAALGAEYQIGSRGRFYARHEFISSLGGRYSLNDQQQQNNSVIGLDAGYMRNGRVYTEYRSRDAFDGRTTQASMGVRNQFMIQEGFGITAGLERVFSIAGTAVNEGTAISLGLDYTANQNWKASARFETRFSKLEDAYITTLGYAHRLSDEWSFLGKNTLAMSIGGTGDRTLERMRAGFAYRESDYSNWNAIGRYEYSYEMNNGFAQGLERSVHLVSTHINWQVNDPLFISSRWAGRYATENSNNFESTSFLQMLGLRAIYDLSKRFDVGATAAVLSNENFSSTQTGLGAELGYIVAKNLRLAGGFNVLGYRDRDLASSDYTATGVYLSLHYKFDEQEIFKVTKSTPSDYPDLECGCEPATFKMQSPVIQDLIVATPIPRFILEKLVLPQDVHFGLNKALIAEQSGLMINRISWFLQNNQSAILNLVGHTDSRNTSSYNFYLSKRRAESVKAFMIASGVDSTRISINAKGKTQRRIESESNIVHEAENRRVEFQIENVSVPFELVSQVEDLQIEKRELAHSNYWKYLISTELNTVADRVNFSYNSSELNDISKLLLGRIAAVLKRKKEINLLVFGFDESGETLVTDRAKAVITYLEDAGISAERIQFEFRNIGSNDAYQFGEASTHNSIIFEYIPADELEILAQTDDIDGLKAAVIPEALYRMVEIQQSRNDLPLIESPTRSTNVIANSVHFAFASSALDHKSQAILMRLVMFLKSNQQAEITLIGHSDSQNALNRNSETTWKRTNEVFEFLKAQGINPGRILLNVDTSPKAVEVDEIEKAENRRVEIIVRKVDVIYVNQSYDLKTRWWR